MTDDFRSTLHRRYNRWAKVATAGGTSEEEAKRAAIHQRMEKLYPTQKHQSFWYRL